MKEKLALGTLASMIEKDAPKNPILMAVIKTGRERRTLKSFASRLSKKLKAEVVRSAYTPNSELALFEIRRKGLVLILLSMRADEESILAIDPTTDDEIAEIESNIYSSNINDVYVRLVSDIF